MPFAPIRHTLFYKMKMYKLILLSLFAGMCGVFQMSAQRCFDMTELNASSSVRLIDRDIYLAEVTQTKDNDGKVTNHYTYGWKSTLSSDDHPRQTLMTAPDTDPLCPQLSVLPPDEKTSIRLASDGYLLPTDSAKGEMIYYDFTVTSKRPLLVVKHAAVLQNPDHAIKDIYPRYAVPWCRVGLFVKDSLYERLSIDHCPALPETIKDFTAFTDAEGQSALWLDWRTDTINLKEFVGQTVSVVLDCRDCALKRWIDDKRTAFDFCEEHHRARMYAHLSCAAEFNYTCDGTFTAPDTICADAGSFVLENHFTEGTILSYDLRFSDIALAEGFADCSYKVLPNDTASIVVPVPQKSGSYPRPDDYTLDLVLHTRCDNDTVIPVKFRLFYPSWVVFQRWNDVLSVANKDYNGGYEISDVVWYKDGKEVQGFGEHGAWYQERGGFEYDYIEELTGDSVSSNVYYVGLVRSGEIKRICSCRFSPREQEQKTMLGEPAIVVENAADGSRRIKANKTGEYRVYTYMGTMLKQGYLAAGEQLFLPQHSSVELLVFYPDSNSQPIVLRIYSLR